jgi:Ca2+-binding RTX toxin-like protein
MANQTTVKAQDLKPQIGSGVEVKTLLVGDLIRATHATDGLINVKEALATLKLVDVADVDLLLTFSNGDHVVIPNGALDALSTNPPDAVFNDSKINLSELFKLVGVANPAKSGSLRLVSENIDANPPQEIIAEPDVSTNIAPPAPIVKVGIGTSAGPGKGPGNGGGEGEGEVPATVVPLATAQPAVYRVGRTTQSIQDLLNGTGLGQPNISTALYTSSEYKVTPSGRSDLPLGAYDATASTDQLVERASPAGQSSREVINGTVGNDTIDFNAAFSASVGQWAKNLHITLNNFSEVNSIQLVFNAAKIAQIPGFDLQGVGVTRDSPTSNSWHVTPDAAMLLNGLDVAIVYNVNDSAAPVDFGADVIVDGKAGPFAFQVVNNLNLTWRDAVTQTDFTVLSSTGDPLMVLPRAGVGVEVFADAGNDTINAGAGPDLIHGGDGDDSINAGTGNDVLDGGLGSDILDGGQGSDTASYYNATTGVTASLDTGLGVINAGEATGDLYVNIENLTGSDFDDILIGDAQKNTLIGGTGNDKLVGRGNGDILDGGAGNDTASYEYAVSAVTVSLASNTGTQGEADGDELISIENLIGGAGNDTFISGLGVQANAYDGRAGVDTVSYVASTAGIVATLTTGLVPQTNDAAGDTFTNIENLLGSNQNDTLIGDAANNQLNGGIGNDVLEGMAGADSLIGGGGNDTASFEHAALGVVASLNTIFTVGPIVTQTNDAAGDTYSGVENLRGSNFNDNLIGDNNANILTGSEGDDTLEGMEGSDTLIGGNGNDTASYAHAITGVAATLTANLAGFSSSGDAASDTYDSIENMTGSNYNDILIGDANNNILNGGDGDDVLEGFGGGDTLIGGTGINTASYERSSVAVLASLLDPSLNTNDAADDTYTNIQNLLGTAFNDELTGNASDNVLTGGGGDDLISGGTGVDKLLGEDGEDTLVDDGVGLAELNGGAGNDIIRLTNFDTAVDAVVGGAGTDTLVIDRAGATDITFNLQPSINQAGGTLHNGYGGGTVIGSINGIENVTVTGTNRLYVFTNNGNNVITGGAGLSDAVDYRNAIAGVNINLSTGIVTGGSGSDTLINIEHIKVGSLWDDALIGNDSNNEIRGYQGADYIDGAAGIDTWTVEGGATNASLLTAAQNTAMGIVMTAEAAGDTILNMENIFASQGDLVYGNAVANDLYGRGLLEGFVGADNLRAATPAAIASYANAGNAYLASQGITTAAGQGVTATLTTAFGAGPAVFNSGDAAGDTYVNINHLQGSAFNDVLIGNGLANIIDGGAGDDVLEGLAGADTFRGAAGIDTVSYAHSTAGVIASLDTPTNNTNDAAGDNYSSIENLKGSNFNDTLVGDGNNNILDGGLGVNTLDGGGGFDIASYITATGAVTITMTGGGSGTVTGAGRTDTLLNIERVIGSNFADSIAGTAGDDWIDGGEGADTINAAGGNDTISYASATGGRTVVLNTSSSDGKVLSNFENILGSSFGDVLSGDGNNNIIEGGLGNDILNGAGGIDTVSYSLSTAAVSINISASTVIGVVANAATGGAGNDTLSNFEDITGSAFSDILIGDGNANVINGGDGNDLLMGGAGADTLNGGNGTDTASYANALSAIAVTINGAGTLGDANGDTLSGIENLVGSDFDDVLTGDSGNNMIVGGAGNDVINGVGGVDTISYLTAAAAVSVNLSNAGVNATGGAGNDTLTNFENIIGSNLNDILTGDGASNTIEGGLGNDTLDGNGGLDTVSYENASGGVSVNISGVAVSGIVANTSSGSAGNDLLSNFENITGSTFNDTLIGSSAANTIDGAAGDDILIGGAGADNLTGGAGIDTASYVNATSAAVRATLGGAALTHLGDALGDTYSGIENLTGSDFDDILYGDISNNLIIGGAGNDDLRGYDGNDTIDATQGLDQIYGGNGDDTILVNATSVGAAAQYRGEGNNSTAFGGGDSIKLSGLVAGGYNLTPLANETDSMEMLDIRDGVSTSLSATSLDIRNFVDGGNGSNIWIKADATGDLFQLTRVAGETVQEFNVANGIDYLVFDAANNQVAAIHWQTA